MPTGQPARSRRYRLIFLEVEVITLAVLLPADVEEAADRLDRAAFSADKTAVIVRRNAHAKTDVLALALLVHLDQVGRADQGSDHLFDGVLHLKQPDTDVERLIGGRSFFNRSSFFSRCFRARFRFSAFGRSSFRLGGRGFRSGGV